MSCEFVDAGLLPERTDAAENVSGSGQDSPGWPRDDPPLRVSTVKYYIKGKHKTVQV